MIKKMLPLITSDFYFQVSQKVFSCVSPAGWYLYLKSRHHLIYKISFFSLLHSVVQCFPIHLGLQSWNLVGT